jgi:hypothetical protein
MTLRQCLELVFEGDDPERYLQALFVACSWLRAFSSRNMKRELWIDDAAAWVRRHGQPTRQNLLAWADGLGIEAAIPAPAANRNLDLLTRRDPWKRRGDLKCSPQNLN